MHQDLIRLVRLPQKNKSHTQLIKPQIELNSAFESRIHGLTIANLLVALSVSTFHPS